MSKLFGYDESLEKKTESILKNYEGVMELAVKASGYSFMDAMSELNAETGAMIGGCMSLYKDTKELAVMQAKAIDRILSNFDELKEINENLRKQNETLRQMLQDLNYKIDK